MVKVKKEKLSLEELVNQSLITEEQQLYKIPTNWVWIKLSDICNCISKGTTPKGGKDAYKEKGIAFLRVENIKDTGVIDLQNIRYIDENVHLGQLKRSILEEGDILVSIAGTLGRTAIVNKEELPLNTNQAIAFIRLNDRQKISSKYVEKLIASPTIQEHLLGQTKVTSIPNLTLEIISKCPIPLPPHAEQQRIVDRIESLFEKLDAAKELAQNALDSFENRKAAILHKAFTGELTAKWREEKNIGMESWDLKEIQKLGDVKGGKRLPKGEVLVKENTGFPYIKAGDLKNGTVLINQLQYILPDTQKSIRNYTVSEGDIYITIVGACIGDVGIIPKEADGANLTENAAKITNLKCNNKYLAMCLSSSKLQEQIKRKIASATLGKLSLTSIKSLSIPVPTIEEQSEIVRIWERLLSNENQAQEICNIIEKIDLMKKAILARAFRGELGTNNSEEESAIELLKEVLKEKL